MRSSQSQSQSKSKNKYKNIFESYPIHTLNGAIDSAKTDNKQVETTNKKGK